MGCNELPLDPFEGRVHPKEVVGEHMMLVPEEVSIVQRHGGLWNGQGRFVVVSIQGQGDAKSVDYRTEINFQSSVNNGAADTGPGFHEREVLLKEEPN